MTEDETVGGHHHSMETVCVNSGELVIDREAWRAVVHGAAKRRTRLIN